MEEPTITEEMPYTAVDSIYTQQRKAGEDLLNHAVSLAENEGIKIEPHFVIGEPYIQIIKRAEESNCQLIVIGSRGLGNIKGLMLGSVSQKVSQFAHCPVLIIK